ncbi:MAG: DoxX family membrane protein [Rhizobiales bacterium]|nr:DoxX family membrane protein [Hyphomicrobiales bacterium]
MPTTNYATLAARLLISVLFIMAGANKAFHADGTIAYIASSGLPFPPLSYAGAVAVELGGGLLLLLGYQTKWAALALAIFTLVTAAVFHNNFADQTQMIMFMKNLAIAGGLFQIFAYGGGGWSIDARRA